MTVPLRDSDTRYGLVSILLHWGAAVGVIGLLATAISVWLAPTEEVAGARLRLHGSIGALFYVLIVARIVWRLLMRSPASLVANARQAQAARIVHTLLLSLIACQLVTGPLDIWSGGWAIGVFDIFEIPPPFPAWSDAAHDLIGQVHRWTGIAVLALVSLHIAAAAKHGLVDRDGVVGRMLGVRGSSS